METQTPTQTITAVEPVGIPAIIPQPKSRKDIVAEGLINIIHELPKPEDRARCLILLGDTRYEQYKETGSQSYLRLAKNCYLAARNFQRR
jgi:hypothetical protein